MRNKWIPVIMLILLFISACSSPGISRPTQHIDDVSSVETGADDDRSYSDGEGSAKSAPPPTEIPPTDTPPDADPPLEIVHWEYPGKFNSLPCRRYLTAKPGHISEPANNKLSEVCDQWDRNYFERPLSEDLSELYPQLDIIEAEFGQDEKWYYTRILVFSELVENLVLDGVYAIEIDLDLDARGDILITAVAPGIYPPDEWHSKGVQVWLDSNDDVGGPTAVFVDPRYDGNGYETLLVDSGVGDDSDLAFVKTYSEQPGLIEFGFKAKSTRRSRNLRVVGLGYADDLGAAKFDPVDFFPQDTLLPWTTPAAGFMGL